MSTNNTTGPIISDGNTQYLDRKDFDFKKREAIKDNLFWKAFNLGVYLLFFSFIAGYSSYYINEYLEKKNYENWIYYILIVFLVISVLMIMLIIVLFLIIPYSKLRGVMLLVKSMSNIYGADYADPDIHNSMGTILGKNEDEGKQISNFLLTSHGNVPSQIIRSLNPEAYKGVDTRNTIRIPVPAPTVVINDADGQDREVAAQPAPVPVPRPRPLQTIDVSNENSSPEKSVRFKNPLFNPNTVSKKPVYSAPVSVPRPRPSRNNQVSTTEEIPLEDFPRPVVVDTTPLVPSSNNQVSTTQEIPLDNYLSTSEYNQYLENLREQGVAAADLNQPREQPREQ